VTDNFELESDLKARVRDHWDREPCGTRSLVSDDPSERLREAEEYRYETEPHIPAFARFSESAGLHVLEIGVGAGTDFVQWVRNGASVVGVDISPSSLAEARSRVEAEGLSGGELMVADAEQLDFADETFDVVYSYGVLHHLPDTPGAIREVHRVLKPGGEARMMIYHLPSWTGLLLWAIYGAAKLRPWLTPRQAIFDHLESPGTKAYTLAEARRLLTDFADVELSVDLQPADLLAMPASDKYQGRVARVAWALYPRWFIRRFGRRLGLALLITARKAG